MPIYEPNNDPKPKGVDQQNLFIFTLPQNLLKMSYPLFLFENCHQISYGYLVNRQGIKKSLNGTQDSWASS